MAIDAALLSLLVCPDTKKPVRLATPGELGQLNDRIRRGAAKTRAGDTVSEALDQALVREDGAVAYQVRDDIPIMIVEEAIPLA